MDTGENIADPASGLGDGGANGTGTVRARKPVRRDHGPLVSVGSVATLEAGDNGRMEVADGAKRTEKWQSSDSVYVRLARAQNDVKTITQDADIEVKKEGKTVAKYKGVTASQIVTFAKRALFDNGVVFLPRQTKDGVVVSGNMTSVYVNAAFACVDNESLYETGGWGSGTDFNDKAHSKAYTNAVKNILAKTLMMSTLEDDSDEATPHEPEHKPRAVKNAEALTDTAIKSWADNYKRALDAVKSLKELKTLRAENAPMMNNPGVPQVTRDYFLDKIEALEGALE